MWYAFSERRKSMPSIERKRDEGGRLYFVRDGVTIARAGQKFPGFGILYTMNTYSVWFRKQAGRLRLKVPFSEVFQSFDHSQMPTLSDQEILEKNRILQTDGPDSAEEFEKFCLSSRNNFYKRTA